MYHGMHVDFERDFTFILSEIEAFDRTEINQAILQLSDKFPKILADFVIEKGDELLEKIASAIESDEAATTIRNQKIKKEKNL